jgi:AcrR family transcriptional regulator
MEKPAYHHGDLRQALIDASLALIADKGVAGLSLRAVARAAGVSAAAPYHHFESRAALLAAVAEQGFTLLHGMMRDAMERAGDDAYLRLRDSGSAYVAFALKHPGHFRLMFRPELADHEAYPALDAAGRPVFDALVSLVAECQAAGVVPPGDPLPYALLCWSTMQGVSTLLLDGPLGTGRFRDMPIPPAALGPMLSELLSQTFCRAVARSR